MQDGEYCKLDNIRDAAPNAVPSPLMKTLWLIILDERLKSDSSESDLFSWTKRFKMDGLTVSLRMELRKILATQVVIRKPFESSFEQIEQAEHSRTENPVDWEVVLSTGNVHGALSELRKEPKWGIALPDLLSDFSLLLHDFLDLYRELSGDEPHNFISFVDQPSIGDHPQNDQLFDWTALIELTRDAWVALYGLDPRRARLVAGEWIQFPYPLFKRLALFAAEQDEIIPVTQILDWLQIDDHWWLWAIETRREIIRLLVKLTPRLGSADKLSLENAILQGPPRAMYENFEENLKVRLIERSVWLRLAKVHEAGWELGDVAQGKLEELSQKYSNWHLEADHRDEIAIWTSSKDDTLESIFTPQEQDKMVEWLKQFPSSDPWREDDWQLRCRNDFGTVSGALISLAHEGVWPEERWATALRAWTDEKNLEISWNQVATFFADLSDQFFQTVVLEMSFWLKAQALKFVGQEQLFLGLIRRIMNLKHNAIDSVSKDLVTPALNHPIGCVAEALMQLKNRSSPQGDDGLSNEIRTFLVDLCNPDISKFHHGRVILARHSIALFQWNDCWTSKHLLPFFDWQCSEASAMWQSFLLSPRLHWPLMNALKKQFLDTAEHFVKLGRFRKQYPTLLTFAALEPNDTFNNSEMTTAVRSLPQEGLDYVAIRLVLALDGAGKQRGFFWRNRILPFLESSWPRATDSLSTSVSGSFAQLCIAAGDAFPRGT